MNERLNKLTHQERKICAGVMSGTSLDGIDIAFCEITGHGAHAAVQLLYFETVAYTGAERDALLFACSPETGTVAEICLLNKDIGLKIGTSVAAAAKRAGIPLSALDFVSSHGQTVFHAPAQGATLQIGDLAEIAACTGTLAVGDFRPSDMAYGGQGAPLVPYSDQILYRSPNQSRILINIGGISNLTALPKGTDQTKPLLAFDTGPGNVLSDNLIRLHSAGASAYDPEGKTAAGGTVSEALHKSMIQEDAFPLLPPPKSTGRERYTMAYAEKLLHRGRGMGLGFPDILATATDYTATTIASAIKNYVKFSPDEIYVSGGGWHNLFLRQQLQTHLGQEILPAELLGISGDAKEAVAFALLGHAFLLGEVNNVPGATGASRGVVMGKLAFPSGAAVSSPAAPRGSPSSDPAGAAP